LEFLSKPKHALQFFMSIAHAGDAGVHLVNPNVYLVSACVLFTAFGCASVVPPDGATVQQYGDDVAVVCNQSQDVFYVTCSADDVWVGEIGNCTTRSSWLI
jgi:hypothetical protein